MPDRTPDIVTAIKAEILLMQAQGKPSSEITARINEMIRAENERIGGEIILAREGIR